MSVEPITERRIRLLATTLDLAAAGYVQVPPDQLREIAGLLRDFALFVNVTKWIPVGRPS